MNPRGLPPGPPGPGDDYFFTPNVGKALHDLRKTYGPVMSMQVEGKTWIILNDYNSILEGLVFKEDIFSGRPNTKGMIIGGIPGGIVLADYGTHWRNWRKFGLVALQRFKAEKSSTEIVAEEVPFLVKSLTVKNNDTLKTKLSCAVSNLLSKIVIGERFSCEDGFHTLNILLAKLSGSSEECRYFGSLCDLRHFGYKPDVGARILDDLQIYDDLFNEFVNRQKRVFDALFEQMKQKVPEDRDLKADNLRSLMKELIQMGTRITSAALRWMILALARRPDVQRKILEEALNVLGESEVSSQELENQMPHTRSFLKKFCVTEPHFLLYCIKPTRTAKCTVTGYRKTPR